MPGAGVRAAATGEGVPPTSVDVTEQSPAVAAPEVPPEHAPASEAPPPGLPSAVSRPPTGIGGSGHLPGPGAPPAPHPAYGYPQQHSQPPAYGPAQNSGGWGGQGPAAGSTPPYGPPPYGYGDPAQQEPRRRSGRSTAVLVVVALVVALGAGGSVYALMRGGGTGTSGAPDPSRTAAATRTHGPATPAPSSPATDDPTSRSPSAGAVPDAYLGTWNAVIDNANGRSARRLVVQQGEVGDTVLSLTADGPAGSGAYHCVFQAKLDGRPTGDGPLEIGPSTVVLGRPATSCTPGAATRLTILPDGRLQRVNTSTGESLTYTKEG